MEVEETALYLSFITHITITLPDGGAPPQAYFDTNNGACVCDKCYSEGKSSFSNSMFKETRVTLSTLVTVPLIRLFVCLHRIASISFAV